MYQNYNVWRYTRAVSYSDLYSKGLKKSEKDLSTTFTRALFELSETHEKLDQVINVSMLHN